MGIISARMKSVVLFVVCTCAPVFCVCVCVFLHANYCILAYSSHLREIDLVSCCFYIISIVSLWNFDRKI